ncbi:MAG TPA: leucyl aminopeptidase [Blastocatellia bacterium]|nr:leucyl aminopeptidase [Blastocatellia bacterium]
MKIIASRTSLGEISEDVLIVPVFEGETPGDSENASALAALDHLTRGAVASVFEDREMTGKRDRWVLLHNVGQFSTKRLLLYGAGNPEKIDSISLGRLAGAAVRTLIKNRGIRTAAFLVTRKLESEAFVQAIVEGALIGQMSGELYRSKDEPAAEIETLDLVSELPDPPDFERAVKAGTAMAEATNLARMLGYEPSNVMTPSELAFRAQKMAQQEGLGFEALGEEEMKHLGMGALLAVSRGSQEPARLIVMSYEPGGAGDAPRASELIALVGKGITFDSGGISIKPAAKMEDMKYDMGGGAAVIGAMQVIARLRPNVRVIGLVPASENLPSGRAVKPGDVVRSLSGKTIEVVNTDAEGRLVLADAITYAINRGATCIVDAATLTGACVIALGEARAAVMGTDSQLIDDLVKAGEQCGERLWPMPLDQEYGEIIRSDIADVKNVGNRTAGSITGGFFLKLFAGSTPWAHLDIAGTAWAENETPYIAKGATGFGVRLLATFVLNRAAANQHVD